MRWMRNLLSASRNDPISGWVVGCALLVCPFAIWYGVAVDRDGFLLNVAASLALVGPGLFITNRVVRNWNARRFLPIVEELPKHFSVLLRRLARDLEKAGISLDSDAQPVTDNKLGRREKLELLADRAGECAILVDRAALVDVRPTELPTVLIELTVSRAADHLDKDVDRLDAAVGLPELSSDRERLRSAATAWDGYRGTSVSSVEVLLTAKTVLDAMASLARQVADNLPQHMH